MKSIPLTILLLCFSARMLSAAGDPAALSPEEAAKALQKLEDGQLKQVARLLRNCRTWEKIYQAVPEKELGLFLGDFSLDGQGNVTTKIRQLFHELNGYLALCCSAHHVDLFELLLKEDPLQAGQKDPVGVELLRRKGNGRDMSAEELCSLFRRKLVGSSALAFLEYLDFAMPEPEELDCLSELLPHCPGVTGIDLSYSEVDGMMLRRIASCCPGIQELVLEFCVYFTNTDLIRLIHFRPCIRLLNLNGCRQIQDKTLKALAEHNTCLQEIYLDATAVSWDGIYALVTHCQELKKVLLPRARRFDGIVEACAEWRSKKCFEPVEVCFPGQLTLESSAGAEILCSPEAKRDEFLNALEVSD